MGSLFTVHPYSCSHILARNDGMLVLLHTDESCRRRGNGIGRGGGGGEGGRVKGLARDRRVERVKGMDEEVGDKRTMKELVREEDEEVGDKRTTKELLREEDKGVGDERMLKELVREEDEGLGKGGR